MVFQSKHEIGLTPEVHGLVARYAIKNHIMMDSAVTTIFLRGMGCVIDEVLEPVQVRSGVKERQPTVSEPGINPYLLSGAELERAVKERIAA